MQHCTGNGRTKLQATQKPQKPSYSIALLPLSLSLISLHIAHPAAKIPSTEVYRDHSHATGVPVPTGGTGHSAPVCVDLMLKMLKLEQRQLTNLKDTQKSLRHIGTARRSDIERQHKVHQVLRGQSAHMILIFTTKLGIFEAPECKSSVTSSLRFGHGTSACVSVSGPARLR